MSKKNEGKESNRSRSKTNRKEVPGNTLGSEVGLRGGFKKLRATWNAATESYEYEECWGRGSDGNDKWEPKTDEGNVATILYIGGPKDGEVDW